MSEEKPNSWWGTLPGLMTAAAAVITALTGLLIGLGQLGVFDAGRSGSVSGPPTAVGPSQPGAATQTGNSPRNGNSQQSGSPAADPGTSPDGSPGWTVTLPDQRKYRSGDVEYELLRAQARPDADGKITLTFSVRCTNYGRYDLNFWDSTFRLNVAGISTAPDSGLNELVAGDASKAGDVTFTVPASTREAALRIKFLGGESTVKVLVASP